MMNMKNVIKDEMKNYYLWNIIIIYSAYDDDDDDDDDDYDDDYMNI